MLVESVELGLFLTFIKSLAGANAAPPEDVGGAPGYAEFLEAILDPDHPEHHAMREWCGEDFEPGRFDLSAVNESLERLKV